jgi:hypothetical protein
MMEELPELYDVDDAGLSSRYSNGAHAFVPWNLYSSWEITGTLLFVFSPPDHVALVISLSEIDLAQQEYLRRILTQTLNERGRFLK